jgi:hypothetical protein
VTMRAAVWLAASGQEASSAHTSNQTFRTSHPLHERSLDFEIGGRLPIADVSPFDPVGAVWRRGGPDQILLKFVSMLRDQVLKD